MAQRFYVHDLADRSAGPVSTDVAGYLRFVNRRFGNWEFAETRVFTCRSWRATRGGTRPHELHWNAEDVPDEILLGKIGWTAGDDLIARVAEELGRGEAVRLFLFNSDADLCFQEVLVPAPA